MTPVKPFLSPEWRAQLRATARQARQAADAFAQICREGDAEQLLAAHQLVNEVNGDAWRYAMASVARLPAVSPEIQAAFAMLWSEELPLRVGHRPTMAKALRKLLPGTRRRTPLELYRGTTYGERRRKAYGFSWTPDLVVARSTASKWSRPALEQDGAFDDRLQGVVLWTRAPPEAVLLIHQDEIVVDPFRLGSDRNHGTDPSVSEESACLRKIETSE